MQTARKIARGTKTVLKQAYIYAPTLATLGLYKMHSQQTGEALLRKGHEHNVYGYMVGYSMWTAYEVARDNAAARGIEPSKAGVAFLATGVGGLLGAKAMELAQFSPTFSEVLINHGGTWYGGVLGGIATLYLYSKTTKVSFVKLLDSLTPAALIGQGIGRIGCWSAGCCPGEIMGVHTEPISATFNIIAGLWLTRHLRNGSFDGQTSMLGLTAYALFRFGIEFFRHEPTVLGGLTLAQMISLGIATTTLTLYAKHSKRLKESAAAVVEKVVQKPAQKAKQRAAELVALTPLLWYCQPQVGIVVGLINLGRTIKESVRWLRTRKNPVA